jgi:hypothetical protein
MDISALDMGTIAAFIGIFFKMQSDKALSAEELGRMKQQIKSLETRAGQVDNKLGDIDEKLSLVLAAIARLDSQMTMLVSQG